MATKKLFAIAVLSILSGSNISAQQIMPLQAVLDSIEKSNPSLKMYDYEIRSMDEAAKGARSWMPTEFGAGFFMTPYDVSRWKKTEDGMGGFEEGMGQFMVSVQQMFPNSKKQDAESEYMLAMSSAEKETRNYTLNQLFSEAKRNYYDLVIIQKKINILDQNEKLLSYMIKSAELRYKNGLEKINAYYKAVAALGGVQKMRVMMEYEILQKKIVLNTLMTREKLAGFEADTSYVIKDYSAYLFDSTVFLAARSDLKAVDREIQLNWLKYNAEQSKLKPEFGIRYDHMFAWGQQPWQFTLMGMVRIPILKGSSRMYKANMESIRWKNESLQQQKQMILNEAAGMAHSMSSEIIAKQKQVRLYEERIIPALRNNFSTFQLAYEQNTEELFMLFDAWESLSMTQIDYLDQVRELLIMQVELERILEIK